LNFVTGFVTQSGDVVVGPFACCTLWKPSIVRLAGAPFEWFVLDLLLDDAL